MLDCIKSYSKLRNTYLAASLLSCLLRLLPVVLGRRQRAAVLQRNSNKSLPLINLKD